MKIKKFTATVLSGIIGVSASVSPFIGTAFAAADGGYTEEQIANSSVKPYLSVTKNVIPYEYAVNDREVSVNIYVYNNSSYWYDSGELAYASTGFHFYYDSRLEIAKTEEGKLDITQGYATSDLEFVAELEDENPDSSMRGLFLATTGAEDLGKEGLMYTINFLLPEELEGEEVFFFDVQYKSNEYTSDIFTNIAKDSTGKLMQAYLFTQGIYTEGHTYSDTDDYLEEGSTYDGYIAIGKAPETTTTDVPSTNLDSVTDIDISVSLNSFPDKTTYNIGELLDLTGGTYDVYVTYTFSDESTMTYNRYDVNMNDGNYLCGAFDGDIYISIDTSEFDNSTTGSYPIKIRVESTKNNLTHSFYVDVVEPETTSTTSTTTTTTSTTTSTTTTPTTSTTIRVTSTTTSPQPSATTRVSSTTTVPQTTTNTETETTALNEKRQIVIPYNESSNSLATGNEGTDVRKNIYNVWGNDVTDIDGANTEVLDHITVNFTVSGIGTDSVRVNDDGSEEQLIAWLCGDAGTNDCWKEGDNGYAPVNINGDGSYSVTWELTDDSASVECLILQSNINFYSYLDEDGSTIEDSGVNISIDSITTGYYVLGDIDNDGYINATDASEILIEYAALSTGGDSVLSLTQKYSADVNEDGKRDATDASFVLGYYSHLSTGGKLSFGTFIDDNSVS